MSFWLPHQHPRENEHALAIDGLPLLQILFSIFFPHLLVIEIIGWKVILFTFHICLQLSFTSAYSLFLKSEVIYTSVIQHFSVVSKYVPVLRKTSFVLRPEDHHYLFHLWKTFLFIVQLTWVSFFFFAINIFLSAKMARHLNFCDISKSKRQDRVQPFLFLEERRKLCI